MTMIMKGESSRHRMTRPTSLPSSAVTCHPTRRVLVVVHDGDGDGQFLCGEDHHATDHPRIVGLEHIAEPDPTIREVMDIPEGLAAQRVAAAAPRSRARSECSRHAVHGVVGVRR